MDTRILMEEPKTDKLTKELQGMALGTFGLYILLAFLTYNTADVSWNSYSSDGGIKNLAGRLGAQIADICFISFGLTSYLIPLTILYISYTLSRFKEIRLRSYKLTAAFGLFISLTTLFAFFRDKTVLFEQTVPTGGAVGVIMSRFFQKYHWSHRRSTSAFAAISRIYYDFVQVLFCSFYQLVVRDIKKQMERLEGTPTTYPQ